MLWLMCSWTMNMTFLGVSVLRRILPENIRISPPPFVQQKTQEPSRISLHERNKVKRPSRGRKRKAVSRRRSLAGVYSCISLHYSLFEFFVILFELLLISYLNRGWYVLGVWGKAKLQNQGETFGILERRKVFIWTRSRE